MISQHLNERFVNLFLYNPIIDEEEGVATFLLYNLSGQICGYQQYRPSAGKEKKNHPREGRYFTYRTSGKVAVFGLEVFNRNGPLFVTEGIFDCVRIHNLGFAAIATLSNDPKHISSWLNTLGRKTVAVCDPGASGDRIKKYTNYYIKPNINKDLGDMTNKEVEEVLKDYLK